MTTNYPAWGAALGMAVAAAGFAVIAVAHFARDVSHPRVVLIIGMNFILVGSIVAVRAIRGSVLRRRSLRNPGLPWKTDHRWNLAGADDGGYRRPLRLLVVIALIGFFVVPFHLILFSDGFGGDGLWIVWTFVIGVDLVLLIGLIQTAYMLVRAARFGRCRVRFPHFPLCLGDTVELYFEGTRALRRRNVLAAELLCIRERLETTGSGDSRTTRHAHEVLHDDSKRFSTDPAGRATLRFDLPADAPPTDLLGDPPHYWELVVTAEIEGIDYEGIFLMPVYRCRKG